jgi:NarL family two-component system sensor histidine kinase LiaS
VVTIMDEGVGFDVETAMGSGLGLISMVERLEAIGGSLEIHSTRGEGTTLKAMVPLSVGESLEPAAAS